MSLGPHRKSPGRKYKCHFASGRRNSDRIPEFILQSVHLLYIYAILLNFCFIRTRRINFSYYTNKLYSLRINFSAYEYTFLVPCSYVQRKAQTSMKLVLINADHEEDTLDNIYERGGMTLVSVLFCLNLTSFPTFLTLQNKHNIRTLSLNIKFICTRCETGLKSSPKARYSACF
jgi:hypothetical protein